MWGTTQLVEDTDDSQAKQEEWRTWIDEAHQAHKDHKALEEIIRSDDNVMIQSDSPGATKLRSNMPDDIEEQQFAPTGTDPKSRSLFRMKKQGALVS
jgi:hypothetical protein